MQAGVVGKPNCSGHQRLCSKLFEDRQRCHLRIGRFDHWWIAELCYPWLDSAWLFSSCTDGEENHHWEGYLQLAHVAIPP